jgi:UDP-N-acetylmuramoylalanine--D-glutamate ligase
LDGVKKDIVWIAGGIDKGNEYDQISDLVKEKVTALICLGKDNAGLINYFGNTIKNIAEVDSAEKAIEQAHNWAKEGDAVLLSPACSSFDLFKNYEDRGEKFKEAVHQLKKKINVTQ